MELLTLARDNQADAIRAACAAGASANAGNAFGQTPLHVAALHGNLDAMTALLECGADVNAVNQRSQTPLVRVPPTRATTSHSLWACGESTLCCAPRIADNSPTLHSSATHLIPPPLSPCRPSPQYFAVNAKKGNEVQAVRLLLAAGADPTLGDLEGRVPADLADDDEVRQLLGAPSLALHDAACEGDLQVVADLLEGGALVNTLDPAGRTPLHCAVEEAHTEVVRLLLSAKADPNVRDAAGFTTLHAAATTRSCPPEVFTQLLEAGADVHARTLAGGPPQPGGPPRGATVVHFLVHLGMLEQVAVVLAAGADASAVDAEGDAPLSVALDAGDTAMAALLLQHGADPNARVGAFASATAWAVHRNDAVLVTTLAQCGADVNAADEAGMAPVHLAARAGRDTSLAALLATGKVNVNAQTKAGATALHLAALNKRVGALQALLQAGADRTIKNGNGQTALEVAKDDATKAALQ
jgi:ankyrin repeat protein